MAVAPTLIEAEFQEQIRLNPFNRELLDRLPALGLPDGHLTAGCLFQTIWNARTGQSPNWGIKDYDLFYFDAADTSWDAEDAIIQSVNAAFADLPICIEVKNQARVHLWYEQRFGVPYPKLTSAADGIGRYLVDCTCVGLSLDTGRLVAPAGLEDLYSGQMRINPRHPQPAMFMEKAASYQSRWPWLTIHPV
jgi:uncharacterized protein